MITHKAPQITKKIAVVILLLQNSLGVHVYDCLTVTHPRKANIGGGE